MGGVGGGWVGRRIAVHHRMNNDWTNGNNWLEQKIRILRMNKRSAWWHNSAYLRQLVKNGRIGVENQMFNGRTSNFQGTSSLCAVL